MQILHKDNKAGAMRMGKVHQETAIRYSQTSESGLGLLHTYIYITDSAINPAIGATPVQMQTQVRVGVEVEVEVGADADEAEAEAEQSLGRHRGGADEGSPNLVLGLRTTIDRSVRCNRFGNTLAGRYGVWSSVICVSIQSLSFDQS